MNWISLESADQLSEIKQQPGYSIIFKHSTRCSTSQLVKSRLERSKLPGTADFYYLDLIRYRPVSNKIAETFRIDHESPQILLIRDGKCIYDESHMGITMDEISDAITFPPTR